MEFENVNNMNIALEASMKKNKRSYLSKLVHRLKKCLRKAKPQCPLQCYTSNCEEEEADNRKNDELEREENRRNEEIERRMADNAVADMRQFFYTTKYQRAQRQVY